MMRINVSDVRRQTSILGKAIFKEIGDKFAAALWTEFELLIIETPQWSGTAAASWNMAMGRSGGEVRVQSGEGLNKGHMHAVAIAVNANFGRLAEISTRYGTADISVWNDVEYTKRLEYGPLRAINQPGRAFVRFKERVKNMSIAIDDIVL